MFKVLSATAILTSTIMARRLGFEPRVSFDTPVFKTGALSQTLPSPHIKKVLIKELFSEHLQSPSSLVTLPRVERGTSG